MKQLLCTLFLLFFELSQAQKIPSLIMNLNDVEAESQTAIPFSTVQVIDARFDQSNVGSINQVRKANSSGVKCFQATASFPDSLNQYLPQLLRKLFVFQETSQDTLVLLIKQFRISDHLLNNFNLQFEPELFLRLSLSAFHLKQKQLTKLFSVDDLFSKRIPSDRILKEEVMSAYRNEVTLQLLQKAFDNKSWQGTTSTTFALPAVHQGLQKRFNLPLFTDSVLRPGIYMNFQEFKQNAPSLINVRFEMKKDKVVSAKDATGKTLKLENYWGVCSGKKQFILFHGDLCELFPSDKSFYFRSYTRRNDLSGLPSFGDYAPQTGLLGAALQKNLDSEKFRRCFFLNMDEEAVYLEEVFGKSSLKQMQKELLK